MARILIVDDDASLASVLAHYFRNAGHTPLPAPTGHAALLAARAHPDLIFLDLGLPDISGDEVLRRLKRDPNTAQIPVVVVSGEPDAAARVPRDGDTGAVAILQKPVRGSELCAAVDIVLDARKSEAGATEGATPAGSEALSREQSKMLYRLISTGSYPLVRQVCHRVGTDRARGKWPRAAEAVAWTEIVRRAKQEGLLGEAEGRALLRRVSR